MVKKWTVLMLSGLGAAGCSPAEQQIVRAQLGMNSRQVVMPPPSTALSGSRGRVTNHMESADEPLEQAVTGALQFSVRALRLLYVGAEIEAGAFARDGSNFGAVSAVTGLEVGAGNAWLSLEVAGGRQWLRYDPTTHDVGVSSVEPRVRAQLLLNSQITFGGMIGANALTDARDWTAGVFIGIYSLPMDGSSE